MLVCVPDSIDLTAQNGRLVGWRQGECAVVACCTPHSSLSLLALTNPTIHLLTTLQPHSPILVIETTPTSYRISRINCTNSSTKTRILYFSNSPKLQQLTPISFHLPAKHPSNQPLSPSSPKPSSPRTPPTTQELVQSVKTVALDPPSLLARCKSNLELHCANSSILANATLDFIIEKVPTCSHLKNIKNRSTNHTKPKNNGNKPPHPSLSVYIISISYTTLYQLHTSWNPYSTFLNSSSTS